MKKALYIIAIIGILMGISSCWEEDLIKVGKLRHQIENLVATPGDEEVVLSWTIPEGWEPTDYLISYNDDASQPQSILTAGATEYTVTGLKNDFSYSFTVQAVYGEELSNPVTKPAKPTSSRLAVVNLSADTDDQKVTLMWEKPSTLVNNYTVSYYMEGAESQAQTINVNKDDTSVEITGLTNDKNYTFTIIAHYDKGDSDAVTVKAMPALAIPYFVSTTSAAQGWPVTFTFNREEFPDATDVTWEFPDGTTDTGDEVTHRIFAVGEKTVVLKAKVGGIDKSWTIAITLREWVVESVDFTCSGSDYNGFKGSYPVFSPDGKTVYGLTFNKISGLYAYDIETGVEKWRYIPEVAGGSYNPATVNPVNGDIYYGTQTAKQFYCVSPEGKLRWQFTEAGSMQSTAPVVSADGSTVFIIDATGNTFSINAQTGSKNWGVVHGNGTKGGSMLINGTDLIVGCNDTGKTITFVNTADGKEISSISLANGATDIAGMAVSDDKKTAYIPVTGGGLASINLETRTLIATNIFAGNTVYAPVVAANGLVVAGSKDGCVYAVKPDLSEVVWTYTHTGTKTNNVFNYSHLCADKEGKVYVSTGQKAPYGAITLNAETGTVEGQIALGDGAENRQMGGNNFLDGVIYSSHIGTTGINGSFIGKYVGGTRKFWGGPGGDICGSGCLQSPLLQ